MTVPFLEFYDFESKHSLFSSKSQNKGSEIISIPNNTFCVSHCLPIISVEKKANYFIFPIVICNKYSYYYLC